MPTYEYECDSCSYRFETVQKMSDSPLVECPRCGERIRRVLSAGIGISFRGSGFYATDSGKAKPAAKKDEKPSSPEAPKKMPACPASCADCPAVSAKAG